MFLVNSRLGRFTAATSGSNPRRVITLLWRPFSRSYGAILPSSFSRVLPIALVFSTCPPVSVLVRARSTSLDAFLGGMALGTSALSGLDIPSQVYDRRISLPVALRGYPWTTIARVSLAYPVPPLVDNGGYVVQEYQPVVHRLRLSASA